MKKYTVIPLALFAALLVITLVFQSATGTVQGQIDPTVQQQTINAFVAEQFALTGEAQGRIDATQTVQRGIEATQTATAGVVQTLNAAFAQAQTGTANFQGTLAGAFAQAQTETVAPTYTSLAATANALARQNTESARMAQTRIAATQMIAAAFTLQAQFNAQSTQNEQATSVSQTQNAEGTIFAQTAVSAFETAAAVPTIDRSNIDLSNAVIVAPNADVTIGVAVALSGEGLAPLGIDIRRGAELALEDRPIVTIDDVEFTTAMDDQDDQCSAEGGQAVGSRFASDPNIVGVVGPMCSSACLSAAPIFDAANFTTISPSCTGALLTTSGFTSFNRAVVSDVFQGRVAAYYLYEELGARRIATLHDGSAYGEGLVGVVTEAFEALGGEVVAADAITVGETDFRGVLEEIANEDPDLLYFVGFPNEGARLAEQRADVGLDEIPFFSADGVRTPEFVTQAGDNAEGVYATTSIGDSGDALADFVARYTEEFGEAPTGPFHPNGYDATNIFLDAVEAVGFVDEEGALVIDRQALADYVRAVSNYNGLIGLLSNDGTGELVTSALFSISQVQNGEFIVLSLGSIEGDTVTIERVE